MGGRGRRHVLVAGMLGQRYDRELVVSAGLADRGRGRCRAGRKDVALLTLG